ncbi:peptidylprolyl isomerase [Chloropicon primus]|uniref:peptidylprolyl isomerase n=1 Tax=Chloropicon primus TaxID=1764295 RepID=A0A5B8MRD1_9CHLO|nr:hypothetical protein A3770_07p47130 [Chloropicon primus]UPR01412.1 peptidylprolyl isomerase [Chloropicon primus]|eukprot:QDZ22195.1 hypothetical protein A3770_07p47130 [Chloropicon primus]
MGLVLLALVLLFVASSSRVWCKKGPKKKVKIFRLDKPSVCTNVVESDSVVGFYFSGHFENGTVAIADTSVVGRPDELDMSKERDGLLKALQKGMKGACNGERRRVVVPPYLYRTGEAVAEDQFPSETIELRVHVVLIDGEAYAEEASSAHVASDHGPASECGACRLFVSKFVESWYNTLAKNLAEVKNNDGKEPPSLTYNEDLEDMIQNLCTSDVFLKDTKVDTKAILPFCEKTMTVHKRTIAEQAMRHLNDMTKSWLPFSNQVCGLMTQSCPLRGEEKVSTCDTCKALIEEIEFDLATQGPSLKVLPIEKRAWGILTDMCGKTKYSHSNPHKASEVCEDLLEDHGKALVSLIAVKEAGEGFTLDNGMTELFCKSAGMCNDQKSYDKDEL